MKEELIALETAKIAKEKGFKSSVSNHIYNKEGKLLSPIDQMDLMREQDSIQDYFKIIKSYPNACTQSLLQKWLREVHNIHITITSMSQESWQSHVTRKGGKLGESYTEDAHTYEEALEVGLQEGLKLI